MAQEQTALGPDDYEYLANLAIKSKAGADEANALVAKMTPQEKSGYYAYINTNKRAKNADNRVDSNVASGVPVVGDVSPEGLIGGGAIAKNIAGAAANGGVVAGVKAAIGGAAPVVKYEAVRHGLKFAGLPDGVAIPIAMYLSGKGGGAKAAEAEAVEPPADVRPARPVQKGMPSGPLRERYPNGLPINGAAEPVAAPPETVAGGTPPPASPPASPTPAAVPKNTLPDQKALNEEALARRRAEYQARVQAEAQAPQKVKLTADISKAYLELRARGMTDAQAREALKAQLAFQQQFGLKTPTAEETRFPKGMRGKDGRPPRP